MRPPELSPRAMAARPEVLSKLGVRRRAHFLRARASDPVAPEQLLEACHSFQVTLRDIEGLVLPRWNFDCAFRSRRAFLEYVGASQADVSPAAAAAPRLRPLPTVLLTAHPPPAEQLLGTMCGLIFDGPGGLVCCSARWVELLDGVLLARLMTDAWPTEVVNEMDPAWSQEVLAGIRRAVWAPEHHGVFPQSCRDRLRFLSWVGRVLGLSPTWDVVVLPFLSMDTLCA